MVGLQWELFYETTFQAAKRLARLRLKRPQYRFDMSCAQAHLVRSKPILRVMQLKLHKPTMAIGYSLRMCARHVDSTNPGRSSLVFRSKQIPEAEMSNRLISLASWCPRDFVFDSHPLGAIVRNYDNVVSCLLWAEEKYTASGSLCVRA